MLRAIALLFSLIFHPLLMLTYILVILLLVNPYLFSISNVPLTVIQIFIYTFLMPAFAVVMMKRNWQREKVNKDGCFHCQQQIATHRHYFISLVQQ